jgi:alkylhydroperoxidase family enzyme
VRALCDFAVALTHQPAGVDESQIEALRVEGWSDAAIQVIAYFNYINRVADAVGIEGEPEWSREA